VSINASYLASETQFPGRYCACCVWSLRTSCTRHIKEDKDVKPEADKRIMTRIAKQLEGLELSFQRHVPAEMCTCKTSQGWNAKSLRLHFACFFLDLGGF
jgi:hypothetical protein